MSFWQQRYRVILQEIVEPSPLADPALAAELEQRTTILPDGRKIIRLMGLFADRMPSIPGDQDPIAEALDELKRERVAHFEAKAQEAFPDTDESGV